MIDPFALHAVDAVARAWARAIPDAALDAWWVAGEHARVYEVARARADGGWTLAFYRAFDRDPMRARAIADDILALRRPIDLAALLSLATDRAIHAEIIEAVEDDDLRQSVAELVSGDIDPYFLSDFALSAYAVAIQEYRVDMLPELWERAQLPHERDTLLLALHLHGGDVAALAPDELQPAVARFAALAGGAMLAVADAGGATTAANAIAAALVARLLAPDAIAPAAPPTLDFGAGPVEHAAAAAARFHAGDREHAVRHARYALDAPVGTIDDATLVSLAPVALHDPAAHARAATMLHAALADLAAARDAPLEPPAVARSPALEAQLAADPDDEATRLVYADFLAERGDPRGELIGLQRAGRVAEATLLLARHAAHFLGPLAAYVRPLDGADGEAFYWRDGFIATARLGYVRRIAELRGLVGISLAHVVEAVLAHPSAALLQTLVLAASLDGDAWDLAPAIAAVARADRPALRALTIGEFAFQVIGEQMGHGMEFPITRAAVPDLRALWPRLPNLRHLDILGRLDRDVLGDLSQLPQLERLRIRSSGIAAANLRALAAARLPKLDTLEVWTGSARHGFSGTVADLAPLLAGDNLPALRVLAIENCEIADDLVAPLAQSAILPRLAELSLAMGTLSDAGARLINAHAERFAHLDLLDLHDNYLSDGDVVDEGVARELWTDTDKADNQGARIVSVG